MTPQELYDHIVKHMTPEQALIKLLEGSIIAYEKLKFDSQHEAVHPVIVMSMAALDMGWDLAIEKTDDDGKADMRGMVVGTPEYIDSIFKRDKP